MRVIVAGGRDGISEELVYITIDNSGFDITEICSGCCSGVDQAGEKWARKHGIPIKRFPADWMGKGRAAGPIRNEKMAGYADALIALPRLNSVGTIDMINRARAHGLSIIIVGGATL